jgi:hypothetical protein
LAAFHGIIPVIVQGSAISLGDLGIETMPQWRVFVVYCIGYGQETNLLSDMDAEFRGCNQHEAAGVVSDFIVHVGINKKKKGGGGGGRGKQVQKNIYGKRKTKIKKKIRNINK